MLLNSLAKFKQFDSINLFEISLKYHIKNLCKKSKLVIFGNNNRSFQNKNLKILNKRVHVQLNKTYYIHYSQNN